MTEMWGKAFYLQGIALDESGGMVQLGYEFRECQLCGMPVSEEMQETHIRYHACQDLPPAE
ncbi:hypothetical protein OG288_15865 [Streptomyces tauricus]|uniref:C2H2-type domain-containing protein n=1 Tax=Streptomyces tauricus TaxID=68274 RepID=A0ABZ1JIW5_9ACTN|nr:hypothetical protein [Streptomyces tauricus]